jgi:hypothetical protein
LIGNIFVMFGGRVFQQSVGPHRRSRVAGQGMRYPSFQAQWDRRDEKNHQA